MAKIRKINLDISFYPQYFSMFCTLLHAYNMIFIISSMLLAELNLHDTCDSLLEYNSESAAETDHVRL
jgi:hypothetical protein